MFILILIINTIINVIRIRTTWRGNPQRMHGTFIVLTGDYMMTYFTESHITIIIYKHALAFLGIPFDKAHTNIYIFD